MYKDGEEAALIVAEEEEEDTTSAQQAEKGLNEAKPLDALLTQDQCLMFISTVGSWGVLAV